MELSTTKTQMASVSDPWNSTWLVSTSWRANNAGNIHLLYPFRAAHSQLHLSGGRNPKMSLLPDHLHPPTTQWVRAFEWWWVRCPVDELKGLQKENQIQTPEEDLSHGGLFHEAPVPLQSTRWRQSTHTKTLPLAVSLGEACHNHLSDLDQKIPSSAIRLSSLCACGVL